MTQNELEEQQIMSSAFGWCETGQHNKCKRSYERTYTEPRNNSVVHSGIIVKCGCKKRGCKCYTPPAERKVAKKAAAKKTRRKN